MNAKTHNALNSGEARSTILFTVDVEDWFQVENLRPLYPVETWDACDCRVRANTETILDLLDEYHIKATFFVLGWIGERFPDMVADIHKRGHEIASHGYMHSLCSHIPEKKLADFLYKSKAILEDIVEEAVIGYRAASFSITESLMELLAETGYQYDSSYNSFGLNSRYGKYKGHWSNLDRGKVTEKGIFELPVSNLNYGSLHLPWSGGGYFRVLPTSLFEWGVASILRRESRYVFYMHPWEIDPGQPRVKDISRVNRFRHYVNLHKTLDRLRHLLSRFHNCQFSTCKDYLQGCVI
jgi:polysaccharide deacetylase family protein (PEP-CTERM system associated)